MRYYIIAGEASGDLHGSNLIKEIQKLDSLATFRCWGGDKMQESGAELVRHYRDLAFMGFAEVLMNLSTIFRNLRFCKEDILRYQPDALILIDYPGFNLRIAKWAKQKGILAGSGSQSPVGGKIIYYISPQVWAWKENRVKSMKGSIDKMLVILPFEKDYYKNKWDWEVEYVGHPLVEVVERSRESGVGRREYGSGSLLFSDKPIIAVLPGSRKQEINMKLPVMLEVARSFPAYQFIVAKAPGQDETFYDELLQGYPNVTSVANKTYDLLLQSKAALVTSGTATLETALFGVPEVVCYKGSWLSYQIGKRLVHVKYISLVNLILDKEAVKELIQTELTVENLRNELEKLLTDEARKKQIQDDYALLHKLLDTGESASAKAARVIDNYLKK